MFAMHIPDGFIDAPTSAAAGAVAIAGVAWCLRRTAHSLEDREIPIVGLTAAFVFAAQMLNFPVANGTSAEDSPTQPPTSLRTMSNRGRKPSTMSKNYKTSLKIADEMKPTKM